MWALLCGDNYRRKLVMSIAFIRLSLEQWTLTPLNLKSFYYFGHDTEIIIHKLQYNNLN